MFLLRFDPLRRRFQKWGKREIVFLGFLKNFGWWFDWFLLLNYDLANPNIYMKDYHSFLRNMYVLNQMISLEN